MNLLRLTTSLSLTTINQTRCSLWWIVPLDQVSSLCKLIFLCALKWTEPNRCLKNVHTHIQDWYWTGHNILKTLVGAFKMYRWKLVADHPLKYGHSVHSSQANRPSPSIFVSLSMCPFTHSVYVPNRHQGSRTASSLRQKMVDSALASSSTALCLKPCVGPGKGREECKSADGCSRLGGRSGQREGRI